jgi:adenosine deaminase
LPHAGETSDALNVWEALDYAPARIGHGIRAIDDPELCGELVRRDIALDISIASNVLTGSVSTLDAHPAKRLFDRGVPITLNTDDPAIFRTTLAREFDLARTLGFSEAELEMVRQNAFRYRITSESCLTSPGEVPPSVRI